MDYDLWAEMDALQRQLTFTIKWRNVDSHINTRSYAPEVKPYGGKFSIRLNDFVDGLSGSIQEEAELHPDLYPRQEFLYPNSQVMVRTKDARLIYGQVSEVVKENIAGDEMIKYLLGKK